MLDKISDTLAYIMQRLIALIIAVLLVINLIQVTVRYVMKFSFVWVNDVTIMGLLWMVALACPWLWLIRRHLQMDFADAILPPTVLKILEVVISAAAIVMAILLTMSSVAAYQVNSGFVASSIGFDESFRYLPFIICGILWALCASLDLAKRIRDFKKG